MVDDSEMSGRVDVLAGALRSLARGDTASARAQIEGGYPHEPVVHRRQSIPAARAISVFIRDGFVDRYSGERLVFPGALKAIALQLPDVFPAHPNWKMSESHIAFWHQFPTVDHVVPVARGGAHDESNFVTTSMLRNSAKSNWLLEELGWTIGPPGDLSNWDGLLADTLQLVELVPSLLDDKYFLGWYKAAKRALPNKPL